MSRGDRRRYVEDPERNEPDAQEQARDWDESNEPEHRPFPIDAPEADALDQEREVPLEEDDRR